MSSNVTTRRSLLYSPGSNKRMMEKATETSADQVVLDLEDAVTADRKVDTRDNVVKALTEFDWGSVMVSVRVNGLETTFAYGDVISLVEGASNYLDTLVIPKITTPEDVRWYGTLLTQLEDRNDIADRIGLDVIIEETAALQNVDEIAAASPRIRSLIFGTGDFSASLGIVQPSARPGYTSTYPGDIWHYARVRVATAAKSNGLLALEGVMSDYEDLERLRDRCEWVKELGYDGYQAIHPAQVEVINEVFTPRTEDLVYAHEVLDLLDDAEEDGAGAASLNGIMIDNAHRRHANRLLDLADEFGTVD